MANNISWPRPRPQLETPFTTPSRPTWAGRSIITHRITPEMNYTIGLDYGTNSVRALVVNVANGREVAEAVWGYAHGTQGVILSRDPNLARQHPADYEAGAEIAIKKAL